MRGPALLPSVLLAACLLAPVAALAGENSCIACHRGKPGKTGEAVALMDRDIHFRRGLNCIACHGGDGTAEGKEAAHDAARGFRGAPRGAAILDACGRCHSDPGYMRDFNPTMRVDQVALYRESHHGKKLLAGDAKVATCVSCHGNHGILPADDPTSPVFARNVPATCGKCHGDAAVMEGRKVPVDIPEKYRASVHGKALLERGDLSAPACNDCHGNHGAAPPDVGAVANVCGTCHVQQANLFRESPKKRIFENNDIAACDYCHSHHDIRPPRDSMAGIGKDSTCVACHEDPSDSGFLAAKRMEAAFVDLSAKIDRATEVLDRAERAGMEVSDPQFRLSGARDSLTEARVLFHGFDPPRVLGKIAEGEAVAVEMRGEGEMALSEIDYRRRGLYLALGAIGLLAAGLWLKVRELDRRLPRE